MFSPCHTTRIRGSSPRHPWSSLSFSFPTWARAASIRGRGRGRGRL